jgi:hypothetical protein
MSMLAVPLVVAGLSWTLFVAMRHVESAATKGLALSLAMCSALLLAIALAGRGSAPLGSAAATVYAAPLGAALAQGARGRRSALAGSLFLGAVFALHALVAGGAHRIPARQFAQSVANPMTILGLFTLQVVCALAWTSCLAREKPDGHSRVSRPAGPYYLRWLALGIAIAVVGLLLFAGNHVNTQGLGEAAARSTHLRFVGLGLLVAGAVLTPPLLLIALRWRDPT